MSHFRVEVATIKSKTGLIFGTAEIVDCLGPFSLDKLMQKHRKHKVSKERLLEWGGYVNNYAYVLENAAALKKQIPYKHPSGAVIWVNEKWIPSI